MLNDDSEHSCGQGSTLQPHDSSAGHAAPPFEAAVTTVYDRVFIPPAHGAEHGLQPPHEPSQSSRTTVEIEDAGTATPSEPKASDTNVEPGGAAAGAVSDVSADSNA